MILCIRQLVNITFNWLTEISASLLAEGDRKIKILSPADAYIFNMFKDANRPTINKTIVINLKSLYLKIL